MRKLIYLIIAGALVYIVGWRIPADSRRQALAAIGVADFFQKTLTNYLRKKFSIPENTAAKRQKLLNELSQSIGNIKREVGEKVAQGAGGAGVNVSKLPKPREIQERLEKSREYIAKTETLINELKSANYGGNIFNKAAERVLDKILPQKKLDGGASGVGGDSDGGTTCPPG